MRATDGSLGEVDDFLFDDRSWAVRYLVADASRWLPGRTVGSVLQYETALKADSFLVMAHGAAEDIARAKAILATTNPSRIDVHAGTPQ